MLLKIFTCGPFQTNTVLLGCEKEKTAAIIDPAKGAFKKATKMEGYSITQVLITHSHWDHIADVSSFKEELSAKVYIHEKDAYNLREPGKDGLPLFFKIKGVEPDVLIKDKDIISLGTLKLEVIHTPGHTPGSVCFYLKEKDILFSGDTLFKGTCGNISFPTSNVEDMKLSLKKLATLPEKTLVVPGHGEKTTIGEEKWLEKIEKFL